jgi:plastocyanin
MKQRSSVPQRTSKAGVGLALSAALLLGLLSAGPSSSGAVKITTGQIIALPGATLPLGNYATPTVVVRRGNSAVFRNYDIAQHDVDSNNFLFSTPLIGTGKSITIWQVATLPVGKYQFHCSLHSWMKGRILVK